MNLLALLAVAQLAERPIVVDNLISRDIEHNIRVVLGSNPGGEIFLFYNNLFVKLFSFKELE